MRRGRSIALGLTLGGFALAGCSPPGAPAASADAAGGPVAAAFAQPAESVVPAEGVTVAGTGRVTGRPDVLRATVGVEVRRDTVQEALDVANAATEQVLAGVRDAGVADDDIQTQEFNVYPAYRENLEGGEPEIDGYIVSNLVAIKIRDLANAGAVLSAAVEAAGDAARVQGVSFMLEDNEEQLAAAREAAFADARAKAEQYAALAGRELGALISVSEGVSSQPPAIAFDEAAAVTAEAAPVPIEPGQQEVSVQVTAVWALD